MSIESALQSHLSTEFAADSNLSALSIEVYPHNAPQTADLPFVTYAMFGSDLEKYINTSAGELTQVTFDLNVWAGSVTNRALILQSIKDIIHGMRGDIGTENLDIRLSFISNVSTFSENDITGTDEEIYRASVIIELTYNWS